MTRRGNTDNDSRLEHKIPTPPDHRARRPRLSGGLSSISPFTCTRVTSEVAPNRSSYDASDVPDRFVFFRPTDFTRFNTEYSSYCTIITRYLTIRLPQPFPPHMRFEFKLSRNRHKSTTSYRGPTIYLR